MNAQTRFKDHAPFVRQHSGSSINFKSKKLPLHCLPFVDRAPEKWGVSFWAVPKTGGYNGGNETGNALAHIYMKHLREHVSTSYYGGMLQHIVLDMFDSDNDKSPEQDALRGQVVGFFTVLESFLVAAAKHLGGELDNVDNEALLSSANAGLKFDEEAYMESLSDDGSS